MSETQNPVSTTEMWERVRDELDQLPWAEEALDSLRTRMEELEQDLGQVPLLKSRVAITSTKLTKAEQERDRETELRRDAERHREEMQGYLSQFPYADEWDGMRNYVTGLEAKLTKAEQERDELRANFTRWSQEKADELETFRTKIEQMEAVIEAARHLNLETTSYSDGGRGPATAVRIHYGTWERLQAALATLDQEEGAPA